MSPRVSQLSTEMKINRPQSPSSTSLQSRKRRVVFSRDVTVRNYDSTPCNENKAELWYSSDELKQQRQSDLRIIYRIKDAASSCKMPQDAMVDVVQSLPEQAGPGCWNIRGLENWLDGGKQKCDNKLRGVLAVLMEQDRQDMEDGQSNHLKIARRYIKATRQCQQAALIRGIMDHGAAIEARATTPAKKPGQSRQNVGLRRFVQPKVVQISSRAA